MKNPVIYMLIAYIVGILAVNLLDFSIIVFALIFIPIMLLITLFVKGLKAVSFYLLSVMFIVGCAAYFVVYDDIFSPLNDFKNEYVSVTGRMCEIPQYDPVSNISKLIIITDTIEYKNKIHIVHDKISLSVPGEYAYGLTVKISGFLNEFDESGNSIGYDSRMNNKIKGLSYKIFSESIDILESKTLPYSIYDAYNMLKFRALRIIDMHFSTEDAALLHIILFGDYQKINETLQYKMNISGASKFLHSAYINILILTFLVDTAALNLYIPKKYRVIIMSAAVLIFVMLNHNTPSFVRSGIFFVVYLAYTRKFGYLYKPDAIAAGILIILLFNPLLIFSGSFVMSVLYCIVLYLFKPHILNYLKRYISSRYLRNNIAVWIVCTFMFFPISSYYYSSVSCCTLIYSLIFTPLIIAILCCMPFVIIMFNFLHTAPVFYQIVIFALFIIRKSVDYVFNLPYSSIIAIKPPVLIIIAYFILIFIVYLKLEKENNTVFYRILQTFCIVFSIISIFGYITNYGKMYIHFINVGHGDSAVIDIAGKETVMIDGGGSEVYSSYLVGEEIVVPYVESKCGGNIDTVIVSHYHKDHCDGIIDVLLSFDVKRIILPDCAEDNEYRIMLEKAAKETGCEIIYASAGLNIDYESGLKMKILLPDSELINSDDLNNTSLVTLISYGDFNALFTGDMTSEGEKKLIGRESVKDIDLLKVGHHGSATSSDENFIKYVSPLVSVLSTGEDDSYNLPDKGVIKRLEEYSGILLRTDENGDITVMSDKKGLKSIKVMKK